jgi:DNA polymerase
LRDDRSPEEPGTEPELEALRRSLSGYAELLRSSGVRVVVAPGAREPLTLEAIRARIGECTRCRLHEKRTRIVFGEGNPRAEILFIGEGPGEEEDRQGRPFVGRAGKLLTDIILGMKLRREDVYIANIVKCRPPGNRDPEPDEIATCSPFLLDQIRAIGPKAIVTLGRPSTSTLLGRPVQITRVRGVWHEFQGVPLMPTYHPAFVLRQYTPKIRGEVWEDMKKVLERIGRPIAPVQPG